jgi:hypothetical protein
VIAAIPRQGIEIWGFRTDIKVRVNISQCGDYAEAVEKAILTE